MTLAGLNELANRWLAEFESEYAGKTKVIWATKDNLRKHRHAQVWWSVEETRAEITIRKRQTEETLFHEVLHLVLEGHQNYDGVYSELYERALNRIAKREISLSDRC